MKIQIVSGQYDRTNKIVHLNTVLSIPDGEIVIVVPLRYSDALKVQYYRLFAQRELPASDLEAEVDR